MSRLNERVNILYACFNEDGLPDSRLGPFLKTVESGNDADRDLKKDRVIFLIRAAIGFARCEVRDCGCGGDKASGDKEPEKGRAGFHFDTLTFS